MSWRREKSHSPAAVQPVAHTILTELYSLKMHQNSDMKSHLMSMTNHEVTNPMFLEYAPEFRQEIVKFRMLNPCI